MIVHNRGWGPQLEDALFVDEITGHYRYRGTPLTRDAGAKTAADRVAVARDRCRSGLDRSLRALSWPLTVTTAQTLGASPLDQLPFALSKALA